MSSPAAVLKGTAGKSQEYPTMTEASPRYRSGDTAGYIDPPKEQRSGHRNAFSESLIHCGDLNVCLISTDTPVR